MKFPSNLNSDGKSVSATGPGPQYHIWRQICCWCYLVLEPFPQGYSISGAVRSGSSPQYGTLSCLIREGIPIDHVALVAITGTDKLVIYHLVNSLQLIWRSRTGRWNPTHGWYPPVPNLQISFSDLIEWYVTIVSSPSNGHNSDMAYYFRGKFPHKFPHLCVIFH